VKKLFIIMMALAAFFSAALAAAAQTASTTGGTRVFVDGRPVDTGAALFRENGRLMVPARPVAEALGGLMRWIEPGEIQIVRDDKVISMFVGRRAYTINLMQETMDVAPVVKDNRTYVPARPLAEALDYKVRWVQQGRLHFYRAGNENLVDRVETEMRFAPVSGNWGVMQTVSRGGQVIRYLKEFVMESTAYSYTGNNTYTGIPPRRGIVAVDPSVIPLGSRLYVEGYGFCRAMDIGSKIKGNRIDVFMETRSGALNWGRKNVKVYLLP
jgi:3D (Asp-Asp-Asp) domain-containing protein